MFEKGFLFKLLLPLIRPYKQSLPANLPLFFAYALRSHTLAYLFILICGLIWSLYVSFMPYFTKMIIDTAVSHTTDMEAMMDAMLVPCALFIGVYVLVNISFRTRDYLVLKTVPTIQRHIYAKLSSYLKRHSHQYFQERLAGDLANKVNDMVRGMQIILEMLENFFMQCIAIIIAIIMMYQVHPYFSAILSAWAVFFLTMTLTLSSISQRYARAFSESRSMVSGRLVDVIQNITNTRIFARNEYEEAYLEKYLHDTEHKDRSLQFYMLKARIYQAILTCLLIIMMLFALVIGRYDGYVTIGDFAFVLGLSMGISGMVWTLGSNLVLFAREVGICSQALQIINLPHEMVDAPEAKELRVSEGSIRFERVNFSYAKGAMVFKDLSLTIAAKQKVGLVGFSGGGKTSFINLILRLFNVNSGRIFIDDEDISLVTRNSLRQHISYIPQDPNLFHRTVMENIRYGDLNASDDDVIKAAKRAQCHEFIAQMDEGYHTVVGERGARLSGGQRQRIAIARAILRNAPIFILDEATSALDSVTELQIQDTLENIMHDKTTLVVAHRLSTLKSMDRILVFKDGVIVEDGSADELIAKGGYFASLWKKQHEGLFPKQ